MCGGPCHVRRAVSPAAVMALWGKACAAVLETCLLVSVAATCCWPLGCWSARPPGIRQSAGPDGRGAHTPSSTCSPFPRLPPTPPLGIPEQGRRGDRRRPKRPFACQWATRTCQWQLRNPTFSCAPHPPTFSCAPPPGARSSLARGELRLGVGVGVGGDHLPLRRPVVLLCPWRRVL